MNQGVSTKLQLQDVLQDYRLSPVFRNRQTACLILHSEAADAGCIDGLKKHRAAYSCVISVCRIGRSGWDMEGRKAQSGGKVRDNRNIGFMPDLPDQRLCALLET